MSGLNRSLHGNQSVPSNTWSPCVNITGTNARLPNQTEPCEVNATKVQAQSKHYLSLKKFHMRDEHHSPTDLYVGHYDPINGIRTASILGSFLLFVMVYIIYKTRCKKTQWTSTDRIFVERYKQKLADREFQKKAMRRKSFRDTHVQVAALEATAKWIQNQPLDLSSVGKGKKKKVNVCSVCQLTLDAPSCTNCRKSGNRMAMENGIPADTSWSLLSDQHKDRHSTVSTTLNCTNETALVPPYKDTECNQDDKHNWKSKFLKGSNNLGANFNKYPNVEYLNLHMDSPEAENKDISIDKNCTKVDMSKLLGGRSCDYMPGTDITHPQDSVSLNNLKDPESKRHPLSPRKSDSCLSPPVHYDFPPISPNLRNTPSPQFISQHNSPNISPYPSPHPSPRPNRSTLSLNLQHTLAPGILQNTLKSDFSPGDHQQNTPSGGNSSNHSSTQSLPKTFLQNKSVDSGRAQSTQSISMTTRITGIDSGCNLDTLDNTRQTSTLQ